jgi:hypothetical protein
MKKLLVLFLLSFVFCACANTQKQEDTNKTQTDFVMSQEELEEWFPQIDPSEYGHCTRCGFVEDEHTRK